MDSSQPRNENNSKKAAPYISTADKTEQKHLIRITRTATPPQTENFTAADEADRQQWLLFEAWRVGMSEQITVNSDPASSI